VPTEEEKQRLSKIQQQVSREGPGGGDKRTPEHRSSLASDMLKETNNMALGATTRAKSKMNKLKEKLDQQVSVLRQSGGFKVHYLSRNGITPPPRRGPLFCCHFVALLKFSLSTK
jgi:hypothetical protein